MSDTKMKIALISSFNLDTFAAYLSNDPQAPCVETAVAPFGQVMPTLLSETPDVWSGVDAALVWTRPEDVCPAFERVLHHEPGCADLVFKEVESFAAALRKAATRVKMLFVPSWVIPHSTRGLGMLDMSSSEGVAATLTRMNLRLVESLEDLSNVFVLNAQRWTGLAGKNAFSAKLWYATKNPCGPDVYKEAVRDLKAAVHGMAGGARKLLIVDLDDTLWGGIVGDVGWKELRLGGHDHVGEAYVAFQRALKALTQRGVLLAIVSKNEEKVACEAISSHPEMCLKLEDFVGWRINWMDKAQNITELARELNLGLQSVVFIDDNPVERARVREALPEVHVPEWPADPTAYLSALQSLSVFDAPAISAEDRARSEMYAARKKSEQARTEFGSLEEWLNTLEIQVKAEPLNEANLQRAAQLFNKTNQMNLSTRRMTEQELSRWVKENGHQLWTFRVSDKFGDSGLTGILGVSARESTLTITDFVLSCRVMGRKVEETMLHIAVQAAKKAGVKNVLAKYLPTEKNAPCLQFFKSTPFKYDESAGEFKLNLSENGAACPLPECIRLETSAS